MEKKALDWIGGARTEREGRKAGRQALGKRIKAAAAAGGIIT